MRLAFRCDCRKRSALLLFGVLLVVALMPALAAKAPRQGTAGLGRGESEAAGDRPAWASEIAPILYATCTTCHHPGGAGPFSLMTYGDARRWAAQLATVTRSRYMPPWLPEHQSPALADERRLSSEQIARIDAWAHAPGLPEGDPARAPAAPHYSSTWQGGTPDLVLRVARPFDLPASGSDVFRNFVLPYPLKQGHLIRAVEIRPGAPEIVHHANIVLDPTASFRRAHAETWQSGVPGMELEVDAGNRFDPDSHFLFWKPDSPVLLEPAGQQWELDPGTDLILNMHLKPSGKAEQITAEIGLYFADKDGPPTVQPMLLQLEHDRALDIPAGAKEFPVDDSLELPVDVQLLGIYPHAHYLARRMEAWAVLQGSGKRVPLITIPEWDIDRQSVYRYQSPVVLPAGTVVHMHYLYDNSAANLHNPHAPPVRVRAGNRSEDEMAHLWLQVLPVQRAKADEPDPRLRLQEATMRSRLGKEPGDTIALYDLAAALAGEGRYEEAAARYRELLLAHPGDRRARNSLGAVLESSGDLPGAQAAYTLALGASSAKGAEFTSVAEPGSGSATACDARFNLARLALREEQAPLAEQQFRALLAECPQEGVDGAAAHSGLATALAAEGQAAAAEAEFARALALDPHDFTSLVEAGVRALADGRPDEAATRLSEALQQSTAVAPEADAGAHAQLAAAYAELGRGDEALVELRHASALAPRDAKLHGALAQLLSVAGSLEPAIVEQQQALALNDADADGWNNLGVLQAGTGRRAEARESFGRALALAPGHAQARANLQRLPPG